MRKRAPSASRRPRAVAARLLASLILVAACGERTQAPTKHAVLPVDGRPGRVEMRLYVPPPHFPLSFSTYLPPVSAPSRVPPGESAALSFVRDGGGEGPTGAFVHLFVAPAGTGEQAARELVRAAAERFQVPGTDAELRPENAHPWAVEEYELRSRGTLRDRLGWMALGRREGCDCLSAALTTCCEVARIAPATTRRSLSRSTVSMLPDSSLATPEFREKPRQNLENPQGALPPTKAFLDTYRRLGKLSRFGKDQGLPCALVMTLVCF